MFPVQLAFPPCGEPCEFLSFSTRHLDYVDYRPIWKSLPPKMSREIGFRIVLLAPRPWASHASKQIESRCEKWHLPYGQPFVNYDHNLFDQYKGSGTADPLESLGEAKPSRAQVSGRHVGAVPYHMKGLGGMLMIMIHDIKDWAGKA